MKREKVLLTIRDNASGDCRVVEENLWFAQDEDGQCNCVRGKYFGHENGCGDGGYSVIKAVIDGTDYAYPDDFNIEHYDRTAECHARFKALGAYA